MSTTLSHFPKKLTKADIFRALGRRHLLPFARLIDPNFAAPSHIRIIAEALERVERGECRRLIINLPPRHGKSQLVSRIFPIWYLGRHPSAQMIIASYAASLATDLTRWQRNRAESDLYQEIFETRLRDDSRAVERWETLQGGVVVGAGVGGPLTGRGADLAIIDDPIKNYEDAISPVIQETVWDWYASTFRTRLHPGGAIVIVHTRWTSNDLTARLLERNASEWEVIKLPVVTDEKPLWPERYDLAEIHDIRASVGEKIFQALYQQEPVDSIERIFSDPVFGNAPEKGRRFAYLDPAFGGTDYTAITIGQKTETGIFIVHAQIWQSEIDKTYDKVQALCRQYNVGCLYYEANVGPSKIDVLGYEFKRRGIPCTGRHPNVNKHIRIVSWTKKHWPNLVFDHSLADTPWMRQVLDYTEQARHDDAPDSLAGLLNELTSGSTKIIRGARSLLHAGPF